MLAARRAEHLWRGKGQAIVGGLAIDEELRAAWILIRYDGACRVALFADDEEKTDVYAGIAQTVGSSDLSSDDAFGVTGAASVEELVVFAAAEVGRYGVHVRGENNIWRDAWHGCVDVEALSVTCSGSECVIGLRHGHALDVVALARKVLVQEGSRLPLVICGGLDIDELPGELNWIDGHVVRIRQGIGSSALHDPEYWTRA